MNTLSIAPPAAVTCDQCELLSINGTTCHETGCPNQGKKWIDGEWVGFYACFHCGCETREGETCDCTEPIDWDEGSDEDFELAGPIA